MLTFRLILSCIPIPTFVPMPICAGVDEAGRGPLAGPVVAGACIMPPHVNIPGIRDSKLMSAAQREQLFELLMAHPEVMCAT